MSSTAPTYDPQNIFAKIIRGEEPCHKVFEDAKTVAFMDVMPRCDGHTLVLPKAQSRNILDLPADDLKSLITAVQKIARAVKVAFKADGLSINSFVENAGGQEIFHTHIHILPRVRGVHPRATPNKVEDSVLSHHARMIMVELARV